MANPPHKGPSGPQIIAAVAILLIKLGFVVTLVVLGYGLPAAIIALIMIEADTAPITRRLLGITDDSISGTDDSTPELPEPPDNPGPEAP